MEQCRQYVHQPLNRKVTAIGGHYVFVKEARLPFEGRDLLYLVGHAAFDTSCCGAGGCAYALVPGFVLNLKGEKARDGPAISDVEPIQDEATQQRVRRLLERTEVVHQVVFL
jgi:hypothetical protein